MFLSASDRCNLISILSQLCIDIAHIWVHSQLYSYCKFFPWIVLSGSECLKILKCRGEYNAGNRTIHQYAEAEGAGLVQPGEGTALRGVCHQASRVSLFTELSGGRMTVNGHKLKQEWFRLEIKTKFSLYRQASSGKGYSERFCSLCPWGFQDPAGSNSEQCVLVSELTPHCALGQTRDLLRSLPTSTIL